MENVEIYIDENTLDPSGIPLVILGIEGKKAIFTKQLSSVFEGGIENKEILRRLRESGGYPEGEGWRNISSREIKDLQRWEKSTVGKSFIERLLSPLSPNGSSIIFEEASMWLLARSNSERGREFAKLLVKTFIAVQGGNYIAASNIERIQERRQFSHMEKELKTTIYNRGMTDHQEIALFVVRGDNSFYGGLNTESVKKKKGIPGSRPLADFDSSIELTAKTLAKKLTDHGIRQNNILRKEEMTKEYEENNKSVRGTLTRKGIFPENMRPEKDFLLVQKEAKKELKDTHGLKRIA